MRVLALCLLAAAAAGGCSVKKFAINKLGDSLANSGTTYAAYMPALTTALPRWFGY